VRSAAPFSSEVIARLCNLEFGGDEGSALHRLDMLMAIRGCRRRVVCRRRSRRRGRGGYRSGRLRNAEAGAQDAAVARVAMPARLHRRGALGVGRLIREEPSSGNGGWAVGSIGSGVAKGFWGHVTTAMRPGVGRGFGVSPRDPAIVVAAPDTVVLDVERYMCVPKARRRRWAPVRWRANVVVAPARFFQKVVVARVRREGRRATDGRRQNRRRDQLGCGRAQVELLSRARMERRHERKMAGMELDKTWWRTQDSGWHGAREGGTARGGRTTRDGRKRRGVGGATGNGKLLGLRRAGEGFEGARWQLEQGVSQPRRKSS
jgi:hypothetical protein